MKIVVERIEDPGDGALDLILDIKIPDRLGKEARDKFWLGIVNALEAVMTPEEFKEFADKIEGQRKY